MISNKFLVLFFVILFSFGVYGCVTSDCTNNSVLEDPTICEFDIDITGYDNVYISVIKDSLETDFILDKNTTISYLIDKQNYPVSVICRTVSDSNTPGNYIDYWTVNYDINDNIYVSEISYTNLDRSNTEVLFLGALLLVIGIYGMIRILVSIFK